jgi:Zinc knuckle
MGVAILPWHPPLAFVNATAPGAAAGAGEAADADMADAPPAKSDVEIARNATRKMEKIDGKRPQQTADTVKGTLFQLQNLTVPKLTEQQVVIAFLMLLAGPVLAAVVGHFGEAACSVGQVPLTLLTAYVVSAFGQSKPRTNGSCRQQLQELRPKKKASGGLDLLGYLQEFQQILSHCPRRPDDDTLIFWVRLQLPRVMQAALQRDPATGAEYDSFQSFLQQATAHASVDNPARSPDNSDSKRKANAHSKEGKKAKTSPESKPGFVSGLSKERRQELADKGACFKCGKPGHISKNCKASNK